MLILDVEYVSSKDIFTELHALFCCVVVVDANCRGIKFFLSIFAVIS